MSLITQLRQYAIEIATDLKKGTAEAERQLQELERQKLALDARVDTARLAGKRLAEFRPEIGTDYQCPRCWIVDERRSPLRPTASPDRRDFFKCSVCHVQYTIEV